jgi:putative oxygen-independent coproporphyrinogen III oxidase
MTTASHSPARTGEWLIDPGFGVYVHIPFCLHRCHYCDFNTYADEPQLHQRYARALRLAIDAWSEKAPQVTSIFFGGGTPTLLSPGQLAGILEALRTKFSVAADAEVTIEANPETVDERVFEALLRAGFTRFSIGLQSMVSSVLVGLGRRHSPEAGLAALAAARRAGADDINADLIFGSPWESPEDWIASLEGVTGAGPDHISAYALTVEERTPLATLVATGRVENIDPDVQAERHEAAVRMLALAGYARYEISNWTREGRACRHNLLYWSGGEYAGFGAGAHAHLGGRRSWALRLPRDYIAAAEDGRSTEAGAEELSASERAGEALVLGLRVASGIDRDAFAARYGARHIEARSRPIARLKSLGLLCAEGGRLRLTERGTLVANEVFCELL